eukprot:CAMPEP_0205908772 /NCGR_PEP_ID=MMETSP1325-20131115/3436_1 /ASSEMBLY_ACC=CAM_ASM_000708 /TAXON_ID=236786 /ORGANISM="Florenciella sp., Strain RCC1007" /LENGTH=163 /DNA_ID=CAMNT_0053275009 /DNA_START=216 /DNA_END=707 /DNA_ORIENTATION=-
MKTIRLRTPHHVSTGVDGEPRELVGLETAERDHRMIRREQLDGEVGDLVQRLLVDFDHRLHRIKSPRRVVERVGRVEPLREVRAMAQRLRRVPPHLTAAAARGRVVQREQEAVGGGVVMADDVRLRRHLFREDLRQHVSRDPLAVHTVLEVPVGTDVGVLLVE